MQNTSPPRPELYCDPVPDVAPFFASLSRRDIAHGACFLAVFGAKSDKVKSLMAIPYSTRRSFFNRTSRLSRRDIESGTASMQKLLRVFDEYECGTMECPEFILAYYDKDIDSFVHNERVWAFWINDFAKDKRITYMEHVAGDDRALSTETIEEVRQRYFSKFESLYQLQESSCSMLDFTAPMSYYVPELSRTTLDVSRHSLLFELEHPDILAMQKELVSLLGAPIQAHQIPISCTYYDMKQYLYGGVAPAYYWSLLMSYARCLYHAFTTYLDERFYGDAGKAITQILFEDIVHCEQLYDMRNRNESEKWMDTSIQIYCICLAFNAFAPNTKSSELWKYSHRYYADTYYNDVNLRPIGFQNHAIQNFGRLVKKHFFVPFIDCGEFKILRFRRGPSQEGKMKAVICHA